MIAFFPRLRPDEMLYSALARYADALGREDPKSISQELFGLDSVTLSTGLPAYLGRLVSRMVAGHGWTAEHLALSHTAYPYYAWTCSPDVAARVLALMCGDGGAVAHALLESKATAIERPTYLRACRACLDDDLARDGDPYWRRVHQLPGVVLCPQHAEPLVETTYGQTHATRGRLYPRLTPAVAARGKPIRIHRTECAFLLRVARDTDWVLQHPPAPQPIETLHALYRERVVEMGFGRSTKQLAMREWLDEVATSPDAAIIERLCGPTQYTSGGGGWVMDLLRPRRRSAHPLRHIVFWQALDLTPEAVFLSALGKLEPGAAALTSGVPSPPNDGAPRCPIPFCGGSAIVVGVRRRSAGDATEHKRDGHAEPDATRGTTITARCDACECKFSYRADRPDDPAHRRVLTRGRRWEAKLRKCVEDPTLTLREVARRLDVAELTVQRHATRLGMWRDEWQRTPKHDLNRPGFSGGSVS